MPIKTNLFPWNSACPKPRSASVRSSYENTSSFLRYMKQAGLAILVKSSWVITVCLVILGPETSLGSETIALAVRLSLTSWFLGIDGACYCCVWVCYWLISWRYSSCCNWCRRSAFACCIWVWVRGWAVSWALLVWIGADWEVGYSLVSSALLKMVPQYWSSSAIKSLRIASSSLRTLTSTFRPQDGKFIHTCEYPYSSTCFVNAAIVC